MMQACLLSDLEAAKVLSPINLEYLRTLRLELTSGKKYSTPT